MGYVTRATIRQGQGHGSTFSPTIVFLTDGAPQLRNQPVPTIVLYGFTILFEERLSHHVVVHRVVGCCTVLIVRA